MQTDVPAATSESRAFPLTIQRNDVPGPLSGKDFLEDWPRRTILGMRKTMKVDPGAEIWQRIVELRGEITPSAVRALLKIEFSEGDHALMRELSTKARAGNLTPDEQAILDTLERLGCLLDIIHSKARRALKKKKAS
jgi:hypothetical protein